MAVRGWAHSATMEPIGSELVADIAVGATVLPVEWVGMFDDEGGTLFINDEYITYSAIDEDAETITIDAPLVAAAGEGDGVYLVVGGQVASELVLHVSVGDGDPIEVVIPFEQRDLWPEGDFVEPVPVVLSNDYEQILDAPFRTSVREGMTDDIDELTQGLQEAFDAADAAAAAAADAAANATIAQDSANGKNKVTYSLSGPGSTANAAGDIWFQKESATQTIIGQWEGLGGTSWSAKTIASQVIANLDAGKLTAGSAFINGLTVKTNFKHRDASSNGVIQSYDFANQPVGVYIDKFGLVAKGGQITGTTVLGGTVRGAQVETAASGQRVVLRNDGSGGVMEAFTGASGETPAKVNPYSSGGGNGIELRSGATPSKPGEANLTLLSGASGTAGNLNAYCSVGSITAYSDFGLLGPMFRNTIGDIAALRLQTTAPDETAAAANAYINSIGQIAKSTSSKRYKKKIKHAQLDPETVLSLAPRSYESRSDDSGRRWVGFIAEEAHDSGLEAFVDYDEDGRPDGFHYGTFVAAHQVVLRDQERRITRLEAELAKLRALITKPKGA